MIRILHDAGLLGNRQPPISANIAAGSSNYPLPRPFDDVLKGGTGFALNDTSSSRNVLVMATKLDNALQFQHQALSLRAYRQQVLAANIANADTPNYKARDIDFSSALKSAMAGRGDSALPMARTSAGHLGGGAESGPARLLFRKDFQSAVDGNTVDMDVERAQFAENAVHYEAGITFIGHQLKMMSAAVQGSQ